jgi:uncharacterized small protein (DUF1192 family)
MGLEIITDAVTGQVTVREMTPEEVAALQPQITRDSQEVARKRAYQAEADPLFFMAQRGEATNAEWLAKVAEIKSRFPYPAE